MDGSNAVKCETASLYRGLVSQ